MLINLQANPQLKLALQNLGLIDSVKSVASKFGAAINEGASKIWNQTI